MSAARMMAAVAFAAIAGTTAHLDAQTWRTAQLARTSADSAPLSVSVRYAAGDFSLRAAPRGWLYDAALTYDADGSDPIHRYDPAARTLAVALERGTISWPGARDRTAELRLGLGGAAPLDLALTTGAVAADVDLTGLRVRALSLETVLSDATLHFDLPNRERIEHMRLKASGARLRTVRLANAGADRVSLEARGALTVLDLTGQWTRDMEVVLDAQLSRVVIRVPENVGIRYAAAGRFSGEPGGLTRSGDVLVSENFDTAAHHVTVRGSVAFGQIVVERISR